MATTITAGNATNGGAAVSADNTGILELKTGTGSGTTAITVNTSQNVGVGISSPLQRFNAVNTAITGGAPASSGSAADPNAVARFQAGSVALDVGVYAAGQMWLQPRAFTNYAINYDLVLQPNGGNVGIGTNSISGGGGGTTLNVNGATAASFRLSNSGSGDVLDAFVTGGIGYLQTGTAIPMVFRTNAIEQARITAAGLFQFNSGYGSVATAYGCRAWVNFNGTASGTFAGGTSTVTRVAGSTTATVTTTTAHGLITGNQVYALTGVAAGAYTITYISDTSFSFTTVATTALTNASITFAVNSIRASGNVSSVADNGTGDYTVNFSVAMTDANYDANVQVGGTSGVVSSRTIEDVTARATTAFRFNSLNTSFASADCAQLGISVFR